MNHFLFKVALAFLCISTLCYQPCLANANKFTAHSIEDGDNLTSILRAHGFTDREREKALSSSEELRRLFLTLDSKYLIKKSNYEIEIHLFDPQTPYAFKITKVNGVVSTEKYRPNYKVNLLRIDGRVHGSLFSSAISLINSNWVASRFADAYVFDSISAKDFARGARFWFTVEKKYENGLFVKYGEILHTSLNIDGKKIEKRFMRSNGRGIFYNSADILQNRPLYAPVEYIKVASKFSSNRLHPITKRLQPHLGVDFELPIGEPVFAPRKGTVIRYGHDRKAGNFVVLLHNSGAETSYFHLNKISKKITQGRAILAGEPIGEVGCTGYCTRPHLHFAVKKNGRMMDPLKLIRSYPVSMENLLHERLAKN